MAQRGASIAGAFVEIINQATGPVLKRRSDTRGRFYHGLLLPGSYIIRVAAHGFQPREVQQRLFSTRTGEIVPVPVALELQITGKVHTFARHDDVDFRSGQC